MTEHASAVTVQFDSPLLQRRPGSSRALILPLRTDEHVVALRRLVRERAIDIKLSLVDQTKLVTAASELSRNTIKYGGGGDAHVAELDDGSQRGVLLVFADDGPGIADPALALTDGYTTGGGLGLSGARRLVDEFDIDTRPGEGTAVAVIKWKR